MCECEQMWRANMSEGWRNGVCVNQCRCIHACEYVSVCECVQMCVCVFECASTDRGVNAKKEWMHNNRMMHLTEVFEAL